MKRFVTKYLPLSLVFSFLFSPSQAGEGYKNFKVAVYVRAQEVEQMKDLDWLQARWSVLEKQVHVDKVYLETFRDRAMPDEEAISKAKQFFEAKALKPPAASPRSETNATIFSHSATAALKTGKNSRRSSSLRPGTSTKSSWTIFSSPVASANRASRPRATGPGPSSAWHKWKKCLATW